MPVYETILSRYSYRLFGWPGSLAGGLRFGCPALLFQYCHVFVTLVSIHDAALIVFNHQTINEMERNPAGSWLLKIHGGEVWLFVLAKLAGTALVCAILVTAYQNGKWHAIPIVGALAAFQLVLLCYLTFA